MATLTTEERLAILENETKHNNDILRDIQKDIKKLPKNLKRELTRASRNRILNHESVCRAERRKEKQEFKEFMVKILMPEKEEKKNAKLEKFIVGVISIGAAIGTAIYAYINGGG